MKMDKAKLAKWLKLNTCQCDVPRVKRLKHTNLLECLNCNKLAQCRQCDAPAELIHVLQIPGARAKTRMIVCGRDKCNREIYKHLVHAQCFQVVGIVLEQCPTHVRLKPRATMQPAMVKDHDRLRKVCIS